MLEAEGPGSSHDSQSGDGRGWLGPVIRGDLSVVDIGKVYYREDTDISLYRTFRPLCRVWLSIMGF